MTCFFDPSHAPGSESVPWSPQWGVVRPVQACGPCAQRVRTYAPPYYTPPGASRPGYPQNQLQPQPAASGYPQRYPQPGGYAAPPSGNPQQGNPQQGNPPQRQGHSTGAMIGAGVAGLIGGAVLGEMMADHGERQPESIAERQPEIVEEAVDDNYYDDPGDYDPGDYGDGGGYDGGYDPDMDGQGDGEFF